MIENAATCTDTGTVYWSPLKSIWYLTNVTIAIIGGYFYFSWSALALFFTFTALTLCLGHSLGMHRRLIHDSYQCPPWLEYVLVHLGVLVGMAGPLGMVHQHDLRDWAQRKQSCHSYLRHGESILRDAWWQLNCDLALEYAPVFAPEARLQQDRIYLFMERTWMLQQLPWALLFYFSGGISWVIWGICARVAISVTGHWLVGYFAHNKGHRDWHVTGTAVQGHNVRFAALLTMGESWHNNHHAFPGSAKLGLGKSQPDPGWWMLMVFQRLGLAWDIVLPKDLPVRPELQAMNASLPAGDPATFWKPLNDLVK